MNILCLGHRKQQGKDTAANNLALQLQMKNPGLRVKVVSLAAPIYQICQQLDHNFKSKEYYDLNPQEKSIQISGKYTPRELLIIVGQGLKHLLGPNLWVNLAKNTPDCDFLIISDLRFKEEAEQFKGIAKFMRIMRHDVPGDIADDDLLDFEWDVTIHNDGTIREMSDKVILYVQTNFDF